MPNSNPAERRNSPDSSNSSVGNGPDPTRVVYAFTTAMTRSKRLGATPDPVAAPPDVAFEDVTNGYVPWSTSSIVACPPSKSTVLPASSAWFSTSPVSATIGLSFEAYESRSSTTSSTRIARRL